MSATIQLAVQMYSYQRRFWWMLSSLAEQSKVRLDDIEIKLHVHQADPFAEWTGKLLKTFSPRLPIMVKEWKTEEYKYRGITRNHDMEFCNAPWLAFVDADQVFHHTFFRELLDLLPLLEPVIKTRLVTTARVELDESAVNRMLEGERYEGIVLDTGNRCLHTAISHPSACNRPRGAGYFQLIKKSQFPASLYTNQPICEHAHFTPGIQYKRVKGRYRADTWFRQKTCSGVINTLGLPALWHLSHSRREERLVEPY